MADTKLLTRRQLQVIAGLARGRTDDDIARDLCLSPWTVADHTDRAAAEIGARGQSRRTLLVEYGYRTGLLAGLTPEPRLVPVLHRRLADVLDGLRRGLSNAEIAAELGVSVNTVCTHVRRLIAVFGARSRAHVVALAWQAGLCAPGAVQLGLETPQPEGDNQ